MSPHRPPLRHRRQQRRFAFRVTGIGLALVGAALVTANAANNQLPTSNIDQLQLTLPSTTTTSTTTTTLP